MKMREARRAAACDELYRAVVCRVYVGCMTSILTFSCLGNFENGYFTLLCIDVIGVSQSPRGGGSNKQSATSHHRTSSYGQLPLTRLVAKSATRARPRAKRERAGRRLC